jgi:hypothetical protein
MAGFPGADWRTDPAVYGFCVLTKSGAASAALNDESHRIAGVSRIAGSTRKFARPIVAAFGPQPCPALDLAGLFIEFAATHFFLDAASFDNLSESANCLLDGFFFPNLQFNHTVSVVVLHWVYRDQKPAVAGCSPATAWPRTAIRQFKPGPQSDAGCGVGASWRL